MTRKRAERPYWWTLVSGIVVFGAVFLGKIGNDYYSEHVAESTVFEPGDTIVFESADTIKKKGKPKAQPVVQPFVERDHLGETVPLEE